MMRATGAKLRMLASEVVVAFWFVLFGVDCGGEVDECGEEDDMPQAARRSFFRHTKKPTGWIAIQNGVIRRRDARVQSV